MKKSTEIIGLPIVSLMDGNEIGTVKSIVFDAGSGKIAAIVVDDGKCYKGVSLIFFGDILGIGESALTIEQKSSIKTLNQAPELERLLEANVNIIDTKVLTKKGQIKGSVVEITFDPENGQIIECLAKTENGSDIVIPADKVYTYGPSITVIVEANETVNKPAVQAAAPVAAAPIVKQEAAAVQAVAPAAEVNEDAGEANNAMQKFEERQKKFLIGKKATRRIVTDNGVEIIDQGAEVTEEVIQKAKMAGKFVELSMSLQ